MFFYDRKFFRCDLPRLVDDLLRDKLFSNIVKHACYTQRLQIFFGIFHPHADDRRKHRHIQ